MLKKRSLLALIAISLAVLYILGMMLCFNSEKSKIKTEHEADLQPVCTKIYGYCTASAAYSNGYKKLDMSKYDLMADLIKGAGLYPYQVALLDENYKPVMFMNDFIHFIDGQNNDRYYIFTDEDEEIKNLINSEYENDNLRGEKYFYYFEDEDEKITPVVLVYRTPDKSEIKEIRFMDYDQKSEENKQFGTYLTVNGEVTKKLYSPTHFFEMFNYEYYGDKAAEKAVTDSRAYIENEVIPSMEGIKTDDDTFYTFFDEEDKNYSDYLDFSGDFMLKDGKLYNIVFYSKINLNDYTLQSFVFRQQATTLTVVFASLLVILVVAVEYLSRKQLLAQSKYTFANAAAHELKTPLAVIQNQCECIMEGINEDNNDAYVASIYEEAKRMNKLVKNLLQYNSLASGQKLRKSRVDLTGIADREVEKYSALLGEKDLKMIRQLDRDCSVTCDDELISLVIDNFLSNAIRYSDSGSEIFVTLKKRDNKCELSVFNKGQPIDEKRSKEVWGLLYRGDESRQGDSTGMGLALSAQILELHKFRYGFRNRDGGVEFYFVAK